MNVEQAPGWFVLKFGGTSVRDATAMRRVVEIVRRETARQNPSGSGHRLRPFVVSSACAGVTDDLLRLSALLGERDVAGARACTHALGDRHRLVLEELDPPSSADSRAAIESLLTELDDLVEGVALLGELTPRSIDHFAAFGERLSTVLLAGAFASADVTAALLDSRELVVTDDRHTNAQPLYDDIDMRVPDVLASLPDSCDVVITQGFVGATKEGTTTTIGRGGSDHTAALLGAALRAREIQIWTDVSGIMSADPRIVNDAEVVPEVTFSEARELATFGAKVLHPETIVPALRRGIPVVVRNSMRPDDRGTTILPDDSPLTPGVHSVAARRDLVLLRLTPRRSSDPTGPGQAPRVLASHNVPVLVFQMIENSAVAVVPSPWFDDVVLADLEATSLVDVRRDVAAIGLCGVGLDQRPAGLAGAIAALGETPILLAAAGPSASLHVIVIDGDNAIEAVRSIHAGMATIRPLRSGS